MMNAKELLEYIDQTSGDPKYQTIELDGKVIRHGYSKCWKSWEHICQLGIDWKGKHVCEFGSFNGYFSFKIEEQGAFVMGYDRDERALRVATTIGNIKSSCCRFEQRDIGRDLLGTKFDIIMAMNMLHHVKNENGEEAYEKVLTDIFFYCDEVIFEIQNEQIDEVKSFGSRFTLIKTLPSHRPQRTFLYFKRT